MSRKPLLIVFVAVLVLAIFALMFRLPLGGETGGHVTCYVHVKVVGNGLVNGSLEGTYEVPCGASILLTGEPGEGWHLSSWLVNGVSHSAMPNLEVKVAGNTTVTALFEKNTYTVMITCTVPRGKALINGSLIDLPYSAELPYGSQLVVEPAELEGYRPLNHTITLRVTHSTEVRLVYEKLCRASIKRSLCPVYVNSTPYDAPVNVTVECGSKVSLKTCPYGYNESHFWEVSGWLVNGSFVEGGEVWVDVAGDLWVEPVFDIVESGGRVLVAADVPNASAYVNGELVELPHVAPAPSVVEGVFEVPYNETHSYWLAWYWVEEENKTWWWSYGINGSKLCVEKPAKVTLHYVLGLKGLPYVAGVIYPEDWNISYCSLYDYYVENGWVKINNSRPGVGCENCRWGDLILELSDKYGYIYIEAEGVGVEEGMWFEVVWMVSEMKEYKDLLTLHNFHWDVRPGYSRIVMLVNLSKVRECWEQGKIEECSWDYRKEFLPICEQDGKPCYDPWEKGVGVSSRFVPPKGEEYCKIPLSLFEMLLVEASYVKWVRYRIVGVTP